MAYRALNWARLLLQSNRSSLVLVLLSQCLHQLSKNLHDQDGLSSGYEYHCHIESLEYSEESGVKPESNHK